MGTPAERALHMSMPAGNLRPRLSGRMGLRPCLLALVVAAAGSQAPAAEPSRLARTRYALHELAHLYVAAKARGHANLYDQIAIDVGEAALARLKDAAPAERARILDYAHQRCQQTRIAIYEAMDARTPKAPVPAAPPLSGLRLAADGCRQGERPVLPVALGQSASSGAEAYFTPGQLVRHTPALAGATAENLEKTELWRIYQTRQESRRVGWERPAGGFVRDAGQGKPAVLINIEDAVVRDAIAREGAKSLAAWPQDARPLYHLLGREPFYIDYSAQSAAGFIAWLKQRHRSLRVVNLLWDTEYRQFGPPMMPRPEQRAESTFRWHDWVCFNQQRFTRHVRWAIEGVRQHKPGVPIGLSFGRYLLAGSHALSGVDPAGLADLVDVIDLNGTDSLRAAVLAALSAGRPVVDSAVGGGAFGILPHLLRGSAAAQLARWPPRPLHTVGAVTEAERALREALDVRRLTPAIRGLAKAPRPLVLLHSEASLRQPPAWALRCAETPYSRQLADAYQAARFLDLGCGFVTGRQVLGRRLRGAKLLVVAGSPCEEDRVVRALIDHVELGGHVVVLAGALLADGYGREADYLLRLGIEVVETTAATYTAKPRPDLGGALDDLVVTDVPQAAIAPSPGGPLGHLRRPLRGLGLRQKVKVNVVHEVAATFPDGEPAIVSFARGKGRVSYLAMPLVPPDLATVLDALLRKAGVPQPPVRLVRLQGRGPWGVECRSVHSGKDLVAYAWNATGESKEVVFRVRGRFAAQSLSSGLPLAVRGLAGGDMLAGPLRLRPFETVLVRFSPRAAR